MMGWIDERLQDGSRVVVWYGGIHAPYVGTICCDEPRIFRRGCFSSWLVQPDGVSRRRWVSCTSICLSVNEKALPA